jgi:hypothetical protein
MDSLDPCIGLGFSIRNANDLKKFTEAFRSGDGPLSKIATVYNHKPKMTEKSQDADFEANEMTLSYFS